MDENGVTVKQGEVGELCVKGPGVMTEYYKNPEATKEVLRDGWLFTGDMARQDEEGFYYLVDRKKDVIVSGGENIYPVEIENFLEEYYKVKDVAVIGLPDKRLDAVLIHDLALPTIARDADRPDFPDIFQPKMHAASAL